MSSNSYNQSSNRNPNWTYDAQGNLISRNEAAPNIFPFQPARYTYDAAGQKVKATQETSYYSYNSAVVNDFTNTQTYDGDGEVVRYVREWISGGNIPYNWPVTAYYLRSTVLGGRVISEYNAQGGWNTGYAYAGAERVGQLTWNYNHTAILSTWKFVDPVTGDEFSSASDHYIGWQGLLDPNAVDVGTYEPFQPDGSGDAIMGNVDFKSSLVGTENNYGQCIVNGDMIVDCAFVNPEANVPVQPSYVFKGVDEQGNKTYAWLIFNGAGYWLRDKGGQLSENLFFDDIQYGSLLDASAMSFQQRKHRRHAIRRGDQGQRHQGLRLGNRGGQRQFG